jgi:hypothetical protein
VSTPNSAALASQSTSPPPPLAASEAEDEVSVVGVVAPFGVDRDISNFHSLRSF